MLKQIMKNTAKQSKQKKKYISGVFLFKYGNYKKKIREKPTAKKK